MRKITLPQGIIVVDETSNIKSGDYIIYPIKTTIPVQYLGGDLIGNELKIITSSFFIDKNIPIYKEEDDADDWANVKCNKINFVNPRERLAYYNGLRIGYKAAQSKGCYSEEDLREAICEAWNSCEDNEDEETFTQVFTRILKSHKDKPVEFSEEDLNGYLSFIEDNYHYHSSTWHDADTDEPVQRKDMVLFYIQSLKNKPVEFEMEKRFDHDKIGDKLYTTNESEAYHGATFIWQIKTTRDESGQLWCKPKQ